MLDVVVIGGGIAGCSFGWAATQAGLDVVLVERERDLGVHTTGRSAAQYLRGYGSSVTQPLSAASDPLFDELERAWEVTLRTPLPLLVIGRSEFDVGAVHELAGLTAVSPAAAVARCPALREELIATAAVDDDGQAIDVAALHAGYARGYPILRGRRDCRAGAVARRLARRAGRRRDDHGGGGRQRRRRLGRRGRRDRGRPPRRPDAAAPDALHMPAARL